MRRSGADSQPPRRHAWFAAVVLVASIALALVTGASTSGAAADTAPHLFVVSATPDGKAGLQRLKPRVIAHYDSYTLVEAAGNSAKRLLEAGADLRDDL